MAANKFVLLLCLGIFVKSVAINNVHHLAHSAVVSSMADVKVDEAEAKAEAVAGEADADADAEFQADADADAESDADAEDDADQIDPPTTTTTTMNPNTACVAMLETMVPTTGTLMTTLQTLLPTLPTGATLVKPLLGFAYATSKSFAGNTLQGLINQALASGGSYVSPACLSPSSITPASTSYNETLALMMVGAAGAAYGIAFANGPCPQLVNTWACGPACSQVRGTISNVTSWNYPSVDANGYVALWNGSSCIVAFAGTTTDAGWTQDVSSAALVPGPLNCPGCLVGLGFWTVYSTARPTITSALAKLKCTGGVYVAGHSLGAAQATIAAFDLAKNYNASVKAVYNFGSPRVGNAAFATALQNALPNVPMYRLYLQNDPVPSVPLPGATGFVHAMQEVYYTSSGLGSYSVCTTPMVSCCSGIDAGTATPAIGLDLQYMQNGCNSCIGWPSTCPHMNYFATTPIAYNIGCQNCTPSPSAISPGSC